MAETKRLRDELDRSLNDSNLSDVNSPPSSKQRVMSPSIDKYEDAPESAQKGSGEGARQKVTNKGQVENKEEKSEFQQILELLGGFRNDMNNELGSIRNDMKTDREEMSKNIQELRGEVDTIKKS